MNRIARGLLCVAAAMIIDAAIGCTKIPPPTPLSQLNQQQVDGYYVFHQHCSQCHNDRTNEPLNGPSLRSIFKKQYLDSGEPANDDRVLDAIRYGRGTMPPQGYSITPQQQIDLLVYLHTL